MACDESSNTNLWWAGVLISIISSIASNLGANVQKYSLMREALKPACERRSYILQKLWFIGLLMVILGSLGDFAALAFAAQSLITPVGGVTMVANVFFAHFWLKEHLSRKDLIGTAAVLVGVVLIAGFADKKAKCYTLPELIELYEGSVFIAYAVIVGLVSGIMYLLSKYIERVYTIYGAWSVQYSKWRKVHKLLYPSLSGILGAQSVLFAKCTAELIKSTAAGEENQFAYPVTYFIILAMLATIFMQLHWLTVGLQWFDAVFVIPVFQCLFITVTIIGGAVYFKELSSFGLLQSVMFPLGVGFILFGIILLSQRDMSKKIPRMRTRVFVAVFMLRVNLLARRHALKSGRLLLHSCVCSCHRMTMAECVKFACNAQDATPTASSSSGDSAAAMDHQRLVNTEQTKTPPKNKWFDGAVAPDGDRDLVSASPQLSFCATTFSVSHIVGSPRDDKGCRLSEYKKPSQCTSCDCPHGKKKILLQGPVPVTSLGLAMLLSPKLLAGDAALRASRRQLVTTSKLTPAMSPKCQPIAENGDGVEAISVGDAQHAQRRPVPRASKPFIPVLQEDTPDIPGVVKDAPASLLASDALASGDAAVNSVLRELSPSKSHLSPPPLRISAAVQPEGEVLEYISSAPGSARLAGDSTIVNVRSTPPLALRSPSRRVSHPVADGGRSPAAPLGFVAEVLPVIRPRGESRNAGELGRLHGSRQVSSAHRAHSRQPLTATFPMEDAYDTNLMPYYERDLLARNQSFTRPRITVDTAPVMDEPTALPGWDDSDFTERLQQLVEETSADDEDEVIRTITAAVLAEGGGAQHRPTSPNTHRPHSSSHRIHVRSRKQKPLAPLPSGVMVGAGLEAAAQLVKRFVRTFSANPNTGFVSPTDRVAPGPQGSRQHRLSLDVSVACVSAGHTAKAAATNDGKKPPIVPGRKPDSATSASSKAEKYSPVTSQV